MRPGRTTCLLALAVLGLGLAACTADRDDGVASVRATATPGPSGPPADPGAFISCVRDRGVEIVDPEPGDRTGRSALRHELDVNGRGDDPRFQAALDACLSLLPPVPDEPADAGELAVQREFARCMRAEGIEEFPDPDPSGGPTYIFVRNRQRGGGLPPVSDQDGVVALNLTHPRIERAFAACAHVLPADP
jgi:hypothetical protein